MKTHISANNIQVSIIHDDKQYILKKIEDELFFNNIIEQIKKSITEEDINKIIESIIDYKTTTIEKEKDITVILPDDYILPDKFKVEDEQLLYNGLVISKTFGRRIALSDKENFDKICKFLLKLSNVDSRSVFESICDFITANPSIIIDDDGDLIFWKHINKDYTSIHANPDGTHNMHIKNVPIEMPRHEVTRNRDITCAKGLHVCAKEYLSSYCGDIVVKCKVDVNDIISVPYDYKYTKVRCCKYIPIEFYDSEGNIIEKLTEIENTYNNLDQSILKHDTKEYTNNEKIEAIKKYLNKRSCKITTIRTLQKNCSVFRKMTVKNIFDFIKTNSRLFKLTYPSNINFDNKKGIYNSYSNIEVALK